MSKANSNFGAHFLQQMLHKYCTFFAANIPHPKNGSSWNENVKDG